MSMPLSARHEAFGGDYGSTKHYAETVEYIPGQKVSFCALRSNELRMEGSMLVYVGPEILQTDKDGHLNLKYVGEVTRMLRSIHELQDSDIVYISPEDIELDDYYSVFDRERDRKDRFVHVCYKIDAVPTRQ
ncbi:MAG: hypothetical protein M1504_01475 [Candidatus Marsarchaeota archaeon]|nr:hypothetical protein [Candidatus Marsarchaeota archaeon]